jgi:hypothetical protein
MVGYLLFAGATFYPSGGWEDFRGTYATILAAMESAANIDSVDWWHIVNAETLEIVGKGKRS